MIRDFKKESCTLSVSKIRADGLWLGNTTEQVAKGTSLGKEFTETLYVPRREGFTAIYNEVSHTWVEVEDRSKLEYYTSEGDVLLIGDPLGTYPEDAILEVPPKLTEGQSVRYENTEWVVYEDTKGKPYWRENLEKFTVDGDYFKLPEDATWEEPLENKEGFKVVLVEGVWEYIEDHIGSTAYSISTKMPFLITELGALPDGYTNLVPEVYSTWLGNQWVVDESLYSGYLISKNEPEAKTLRDFTVSSDLVVEELEGASFQCLDKAVDIKTVIDEAVMLNALETDSIAFRLSDNTWRDTTLAELRMVYLKYLERKREVWKQFSEWDQGDKTEAFVLVL